MFNYYLIILQRFHFKPKYKSTIIQHQSKVLKYCYVHKVSISVPEVYVKHSSTQVKISDVSFRKNNSCDPF